MLESLHVGEFTCIISHVFTCSLNNNKEFELCNKVVFAVFLAIYLDIGLTNKLIHQHLHNN